MLTAFCIGNILARLKRKVLTQKDLQAIRDGTPVMKKGSPQMFRNLRDKGQLQKSIYTHLFTTERHDDLVIRILF